MAAVTIQHVKSNTIADWSGTVTVGNSSGGTNTVQASNLVLPSDWNSNHNATLALSAADFGSFFKAGAGLYVTTNTNGVTYGAEIEHFFEPWPLINTNSTLAVPTIGSWYLDYFNCPQGMAEGHINMFMTQSSGLFLCGQVFSASSAAASKTAVFSNMLAMYYHGTGTASTRLESLWSNAAVISATQYITVSTTATNDIRASNYLTIGMISNIDSLGATTSTTYTGSGTLVVAASTAASTAFNALITVPQNYITGSYMAMMPMTKTFGPGYYWLAHAFNTASGTSTTGVNIGAGTMFNTAVARLGVILNDLSGFKMLGKATSANSTSLAMPYDGVVGTTGATPFATLGTADMRRKLNRAYWNYNASSV